MFYWQFCRFEIISFWQVYRFSVMTYVVDPRRSCSWTSKTREVKRLWKKKAQWQQKKTTVRKMGFISNWWWVCDEFPFWNEFLSIHLCGKHLFIFCQLLSMTKRKNLGVFGWQNGWKYLKWIIIFKFNGKFFGVFLSALSTSFTNINIIFSCFLYIIRTRQLLHHRFCIPLKRKSVARNKPWFCGRWNLN